MLDKAFWDVTSSVISDEKARFVPLGSGMRIAAPRAAAVLSGALVRGESFESISWMETSI